MSSFHSGASLCHQLIMGAGKTTVIAPLLALLLGDGNTLVTQVGAKRGTDLCCRSHLVTLVCCQVTLAWGLVG